MDHTAIVQKVRDILNEHGGDNELSITTDRVLLDKYIESAIPDAVIMLAQKGYRVNEKGVEGILEEELGEIIENMVSLIMLKENTWKIPVTKLTEINSPEFMMAQNEHTQPGPYSPIAWIDGGTLCYLPRIIEEENYENRFTLSYNAKYDNVFLNARPKEATAVCYMTAALVLGMFGDDQGKQRLSDISTNMLQ